MLWCDIYNVHTKTLDKNKMQNLCSFGIYKHRGDLWQSVSTVSQVVPERNTWPCIHYSEVIWVWWTLRSAENRLFLQHVVQANNKKISLYCPIIHQSLADSPSAHWDRVTHICISYLIIIGSNNGLSSGRCQAIIWTNAGILLIGPLAILGSTGWVINAS